MNLLDVLGLNKNDVLDFFRVLERQAAALEDLSGQMARSATAQERQAQALELANRIAMVNLSQREREALR